MNISEHARRAMEESGISEGEVLECLKNGKRVIKQAVKGEMRYGSEIDLKEKKIIVIYTLFNNEERIITTYPIRRKREW